MAQNHKAPTQASSKFFNKMFCAFFDLMEPAQSMATPACMRKTSVPQ